MLRFKHPSIVLLALAVLVSACGVRSGMKGGPRSSTVEQGIVSAVGTATPTGDGDTTSFGQATSSAKVEEMEKPGTYTVKKGDSLWKIAARSKVYGSGWLYPLLVKHNQQKITDPKNLKVGEVLTVLHDLPKAEYEMAREETMAGTYDSAAGYDTSLPTHPISATAKSNLSPSKIKVTPKKSRKALGLSFAALAGAITVWLLLRRKRSKKEDQDTQTGV